MLCDQNIIYFAPERWDGLWRNRQQLMSIFARQNKVLYVEGRKHLKPTIRAWRDGSLGFSDLQRPNLRHIADNLYLFRYPIWAPISGRWPLDVLTKMIRQRAFTNALQSLGMSKPIVWVARPDMGDLLDEVPSARLEIYHVVDEYSAYGGKNSAEQEEIRRSEQALLQRVDSVIVVSQKLYESKSVLQPNTHIVPNGVNYDAYTAALADPDLPADLTAIPSPRIGYSGLVADRLDMTMLLGLAERNPEWSLVFIGEERVIDQEEVWRDLKALPNVHYLGAKTIAQVPHYLKGFDVGLMPYIQNRESENISPLKLYDYLATGLPVASVDIVAAREFSKQIYLADGPEDFEKSVQSALQDNSPEHRSMRRAIAAQHTWEARVEQISDLIEADLNG